MSGLSITGAMRCVSAASRIRSTRATRSRCPCRNSAFASSFFPLVFSRTNDGNRKDKIIHNYYVKLCFVFGAVGKCANLVEPGECFVK